MAVQPLRHDKPQVLVITDQEVCAIDNQPCHVGRVFGWSAR